MLCKNFFAGVLSLGRSNGTALNTSFYVELKEGCIDAEKEIVTYYFGYTKNNQEFTISIQNEPFIYTRLPEGTFDK